MAALSRIFWLVALCFFVASCGTYRTAAIPRSFAPDDDVDETDEAPAKPGDQVRVTLKGGESFEGVLVAYDDTSLTIDTNVSVADPGGTGFDGAAVPATNRRVLAVADVVTVEHFVPQSAFVAAALVTLSLGAFLLVSKSAADNVDLSLDWESR